MDQRRYKWMMAAGSALGAFGAGTLVLDAGIAGPVVLGAGFLMLLAGVVGYLWNGD